MDERSEGAIPMTLIRTITTEIEISPEEIAELFCRMDDFDQVRFFNKIPEIVKEWGGDFCFQMEAMVGKTTLTDEARAIMKTIGEYSTHAAKN